MKRPVNTAGGASAVVLLIIASTAAAAQSQRRATAPRAPATQTASAYTGPRTPDRKPDLNGIWQVLGTAHWNLEAHSATEGVPAGLMLHGLAVQGGQVGPDAQGPGQVRGDPAVVVAQVPLEDAQFRGPQPVRGRGQDLIPEGGGIGFLVVARNSRKGLPFRNPALLQCSWRVCW